MHDSTAANGDYAELQKGGRRRSTRRGAVQPGIVVVLIAVVGTACDADEVATSASMALAGGTLQVSWHEDDMPVRTDLLVHFHGHHPTCAKNFQQTRLDGVLATVNFRGLSSAYSGPFAESPEVFDEVLKKTSSTLSEAGRLPDETEWRKICVSCFSAGYGAVRELLKSPELFDRIDAIVAADSIYAGIVAGSDPRRPQPEHMRNFRRFAKAACDGDKTFVVTHTQLVTPYASTFETADDLLRSVGLKRKAMPSSDGPLKLLTRSERGGFLVLGYAGADSAAHMEHLRRIAVWWKHLPLQQRDPSHPGESAPVRPEGSR